MSDEHQAVRIRPSTREVTPPLVITLRTDSYDCPRCGITVVATDDLVVDLAMTHECC